MGRLHLTPSEPLGRYVTSLWASRHDGAAYRLEAMLPSGCADLVIPLHGDALPRADPDRPDEMQPLRGGVLQGAGDRAVLRATGFATHVIGVHFRPGGAAAVLGGIAVETAGRCIALADLDAGWAQLRQRLLEAPDDARRLRIVEAALTARLRPRLDAASDAVVEHALRALAASPTIGRVDSLAAASGLSRGQFIDRFAQRVGLTPKRYARVLRLDAVLQRLAAGTDDGLAALALDAGFADQAHLANEFKRMTGTTPTRYRPLSPGQRHHVPLR